MDIEEINYKDLDFVSRSYAGRKGFQFQYKDQIIVTVFIDNLQLASAIDVALKKELKNEDE